MTQVAKDAGLGGDPDEGSTVHSSRPHHSPPPVQRLPTLGHFVHCLREWRPGRRLAAGAAQLLIAAMPGLSAADADLIQWGWHNRPPLLVAADDNRERGPIDRALLQILGQLGGYRHVEVQAPIARILKNMRAGEKLCAAGLLRSPERDAFTVASLPMFLLPGHRLVIRRDDRARFPPTASLRLAEVLDDRRLRGFVERDRSYNDEVDALIARHPEVHAVAPTPQGIRMLLAGRVDYLLEHETTAVFYGSQQDAPDRMQSLPFKEMSDLMLLRVLCPKNDWGRAVIQQVDTALLKLRTTADYRLLMEEHLSADTVATIRRDYAAKFLNAR